MNVRKRSDSIIKSFSRENYLKQFFFKYAWDMKYNEKSMWEQLNRLKFETPDFTMYSNLKKHQVDLSSH